MNPDTLLPPPGGRFAHAVIVEPGARQAFIAGQVALDLQGGLVGPGDHAAQAGQCFRNLKAVLDAIGARPQDVAQMTIWVVGFKPDLLESIDAAGVEAFRGDWPIAATTLVGLAALSAPEFLLEVSATAVVPFR